MKYESDILEMIHKNAIIDFKLGLISEAEMREYDEACLANPKTENKYSTVYPDDNSVNVEHISHATA
jgi:DNA-binding transcriptional regulator YiaG